MTTQSALEYVDAMIGQPKGQRGYLEGMNRADPRRLPDCIKQITNGVLKNWANRNLMPAAKNVASEEGRREFRRRVEALREYLTRGITTDLIEYEQATPEAVNARGSPCEWGVLIKKWSKVTGVQMTVLTYLYKKPATLWSISELKRNTGHSRGGVAGALRKLHDLKLAERNQTKEGSRGNDEGWRWRLGTAAWD